MDREAEEPAPNAPRGPLTRLRYRKLGREFLQLPRALRNWPLATDHWPLMSCRKPSSNASFTPSQ